MCLNIDHMELDLLDMTEEATSNNGFRYGFVAIDTETNSLNIENRI